MKRIPLAALGGLLHGLVDKHKYDMMQQCVYTVLAAAQRETPVKSGNLRRSETGRVERGGDRGVVGTNATYAPAVHNGTRPHLIRPKRAKALSWKGASHPVRVVKHPGSKANPFFERAMASSRPSVERVMANAGYKMWSSL